MSAEKTRKMSMRVISTSKQMPHRKGVPAEGTVFECGEDGRFLLVRLKRTQTQKEKQELLNALCDATTMTVVGIPENAGRIELVEVFPAEKESEGCDHTKH